MRLFREAIPSNSPKSRAATPPDQRIVRAGLFFALVLSFQVVAGPAAAAELSAAAPEDNTFVEIDGDFLSEVRLDSSLGLASTTSINDPYGDDPWAAYLPTVAAPEGTHYWEVWACNETDDGPPTLSPAEFISTFGPAATNWFMQISDGSYSPRFVAGGSYSADRCLSESPSVPAGRGFLAIRGGSGGLGGPGALSLSQSGLQHVGPRRAEIGTSGFPPGGDLDDTPWILDILVHEMGHGLGWPHVPAGTGSHYNNSADVMSGGAVLARVPASTAAFNAYASGWIEPSELVVWESGTKSVRLGTPLSSRSPMLMVPSETQGRFHTISATPRSVDSSVPRGVLVHLVDQTWSDTGGYCVYQQACFMGSHHIEALVPSGATEAFGRIDPILEPGDTMDVGSWTVGVVSSHSDGFTIEITGDESARSPATGATGSFIDVPADHTFTNAISALANAGITTGCNPPDNTLFCPGDFVTRGQMAAFIARAAGLPAYDGPDRFTDDDGHTFEKAIERLAQAGITIGCNPPDNTQFCPGGFVTRAQMAAFMTRAGMAG